MTAVSPQTSNSDQQKSYDGGDIDKELDWFIDERSARQRGSNDSDEVKIKLDMEGKGDMINEGEDDSAEEQQSNYLQHLQQREREEDGDEYKEIQKVNEGGDFYSLAPNGAPPPPTSPKTPPLLKSAESPVQGPMLRIMNKKVPLLEEEAPAPPALPAGPPPIKASASTPAKGPRLRILNMKATPEEQPPSPASPQTPPLLKSAESPTKGPKLKVRNKKASSKEDSPPSQISPGPPSPPPPSVTVAPKTVKLEERENPDDDLNPTTQPFTQTQDQTEPEDESSQRSELHSDKLDEDQLNHDSGDEGYSDDNNNDNFGKTKDEENLESGPPIRRSHGYDDLNGDADDNRELYADSKSPEAEEQSENWAPTENGYDFPEGFSEDQKQAMAELQQLRIDLDYPDEDPPEYNVAARLRQLNEELAQEADPDDDRERSIKFKDDLVDLVAPPPEYPSDEESQVTTDRTQDSNGAEPPESPGSNNNNYDYDQDFEENVDSPKQNDHMDDPGMNDGDSLNKGQSSPRTMDESKKSHNNYQDEQNSSPEPESDLDVSNTVNNDENSQRTVDKTDNPEDDSHHKQSDDSHAAASTKESNNPKNKVGKSGGGEDKILVERDGKFELINVEDLTAEERQMYLPPAEDNEDEVDTSRSNGSFEPAPPKDPRPATAAAGSSRRRLVSAPPRRVKSAQPQRVENKPVLEDFSYTSPYALTDQQKQAGKDQKKALANRQRKQDQINKLEQEEKNRENNEAFEAWLSIKRKEVARRQREDNENRRKENRTEKEKKKDGSSESLQERDESGAFDSWLKHKRDQKRRENDDDRKRREYEEGLEKPKDNSNKAFKQWLKKKREDSRHARVLEKQRVRVHKLMVRRSHKALQLARAIRQSQSFEYVDYYGYRY